MKKLTSIALVLLATASTVAFSQEGNQQRRPGGNFLAAARTEDGRIDLSKLPEQMPQQRKDAMKAADKDNDGFLTPEELRDAMPGRSPQGQPSGPGFGGPGFGGPGMGPMGNFWGDAFQDGKLDLSKLPERIPQERRDELKKADKDGDGFLTMEEMPRPKFRFPEGKKPEFVNDDNGIVIDKFVEALKSFDKNGDGVVDAEEQKALAETVQKDFGPSFGMFLMSVVGGQQGFGGFGMGFGGPQGGFGGSQGPRPGMGGFPGGPQGRPNDGERGRQGGRRGERRGQGRGPQQPNEVGFNF